MGRSRKNKKQKPHNENECEQCIKAAKWHKTWKNAPLGTTFKMPEGPWECPYAKAMIKKNLNLTPACGPECEFNRVCMPENCAEYLRKLAERKYGDPGNISGTSDINPFHSPDMTLAFAKSVNEFFEKVKEAGSGDPKNASEEAFREHKKEFLRNFAEQLAGNQDKTLDELSEEFSGMFKEEIMPSFALKIASTETFGKIGILHSELVEYLPSGSNYVIMYEEMFRYMIEALRILFNLSYNPSKDFTKLQGYALQMLVQSLIKPLLLEKFVVTASIYAIVTFDEKIAKYIWKSSESNIYAHFLVVILKNMQQTMNPYKAEKLPMDHISPQKLLDDLMKSKEIDEDTKTKMCSVVYSFKYDMENDMSDLEKAMECCSSNIEVFHRYGVELITKTFKSLQDENANRTNEYILGNFAKAEFLLKKGIKQSYYDSFTVKVSYDFLAMRYVLTQDYSQGIKYFKQAQYTENRVLKGIKPFLGRVGLDPDFCNLLKTTFLDIKMESACDECNQVCKELKQCSCKTAFYCDKGCQSKHWKIHQDTCPTKRSQNRPNNV